MASTKLNSQRQEAVVGYRKGEHLVSDGAEQYAAFRPISALVDGVGCGSQALDLAQEMKRLVQNENKA